MDESSQNALLHDLTQTKHCIIETTKELADALQDMKQNIHETFNDTKLWIRSTMEFSNHGLTKSFSVAKESINKIKSLKELLEVHISVINVQLLDDSSNIGKSLLEDAKEFMSLLEWLMMHVTKLSDNCIELFRMSKQIESIIPNFFSKIEVTINLLEQANSIIDEYLANFLKRSLEKNDIFNKALDELQKTVQKVQDTINKTKLESTEVQVMQVAAAETLRKNFCIVKENIPQPDQIDKEYEIHKLLLSKQESQMKNSLEEFKTKTNDYLKESTLTKELNKYLEKFDFIEKSITETMQKLDYDGNVAIGEFQLIFEEEIDQSNQLEEKFKESLQKTAKCEDLLKKFQELMDLKDLQQHFHQ